MARPNENSLNREVTGTDFAKPAKPDRSLGDHSTSGDATSSISDLRGAFDGADDGMEVVDLSSRYEVQGTLGRGGMGDVVLAYDKRIKRQVAIKRILGEMAANRRAVQRFLTEAQSVGALSHPNIVQVIDLGEVEGRHYIAMEYVEGLDLNELLRRCARSQNALRHARRGWPGSEGPRNGPAPPPRSESADCSANQRGCSGP